MVVDDEVITPAVLMHKEIDYASSGLGVVPSRITISLFDKSDDKHTLRAAIRQTFTYEAWKRFAVSTATGMAKSMNDECVHHSSFIIHHSSFAIVPVTAAGY